MPLPGAALPGAFPAALFHPEEACRLDAGQRVMVLISEDIARDKRVIASLADYPNLEVVDVGKEGGAGTPFSLLVYLHAAFVLLNAILRAPGVWSLLGRRYGLRPRQVLAGLPVSLRSFVGARKAALRLRSRLPGVSLIHAHDLSCGVVGAQLSQWAGVELIYDAHEIEFHRNRRNSWLRTAFDVAVEKTVVGRSRELRVVNAPIAALYQLIHGISPERVRVVLNDHFATRWRDGGFSVPSASRLAMVYVGGGVRGRQLEHLATAAKGARIPVHAFFIGTVPDLAKGADWVLGSSDYEGELVSLVASHRCVMWCCVDDVCLSYRLSLPNKFFQALAVGIPVVAAGGTYLADLVTAYHLGFVFDECNFDTIVKGMQGPGFSDLVRSVQRFRQALTAEIVTI
jgi:glycosyltransferase involved in cell wall biosynthesis